MTHQQINVQEHPAFNGGEYITEQHEMYMTAAMSIFWPWVLFLRIVSIDKGPQSAKPMNASINERLKV